MPLSIEVMRRMIWRRRIAAARVRQAAERRQAAEHNQAVTRIIRLARSGR